MSSRKNLFTLIAAILAGIGVFIFLFMSPVYFKDINQLTLSYMKTEISGMNVIFGWEILGVSLTETNILALLAAVAAIAICVLLFLVRFGKIDKDLTLLYIVGLVVSAVLVFLSATLIPVSEGLEASMDMFAQNGYDEMGFGLSFAGILSGLCLLASAGLLVVTKANNE